MFVIIYNKSDKKIVHYRHDMSSDITVTAQKLFNYFLENNLLSNENYTFAELTFKPDYNNIVIGNHFYNEKNNDIEADPNYVELNLNQQPPIRTWSQKDIRTGLTLAEKVKWDNNSEPEIVTVKAELPNDKAGTTELLDFLVSLNIISQSSADKILA